MTREEEIVKAAKEFENRSWFSDIVHSKVSRGVDSAFGIGFIEGAVWADENPQNSQLSAADRGIIDEIIFALNSLGKEKMISYYKEIEFLNKIRKL